MNKPGSPTRRAKPADPAAGLRRDAEQHLVRLHLKTNRARPETNQHRLVHELQVHQVELEMQNVELLEARSRTEALLEKYTDLYDFAPVGYLSLTADGRISLINLTGASLLGPARSQLVGQLLGHRVQAGHRADFNAFLRRVFAGTTRQSCEVVLAGPDLPPRVVNLVAQRLPHASECRTVMRDVTELRHAAEELRLSEVRYRRLFEAAHDGVLLLAPATGKITDANPFMTWLLGYTREQLVGRRLFEIGLLKDETASREMFIRLKRSHEVRYEDLPLEGRDGRHHQVEVVANLYLENNRPVIQCNIRDITARKQAEEALRRNQALFTDLVEQAPMGVYVVNTRLQVIQVNVRAQPAFGSHGPLVGRSLGELVNLMWSRPVARAIAARFRSTLRTGQSHRSDEFIERRHDTGRQEAYEWEIRRITLPDGEHGVVCFFNDITERKTVETVQRQLAALAAANHAAGREITRRRKVESNLRLAEKSQRALLMEARFLHGQMRLLTRKVITAQEEERKKISRELHDDVMQTLVGINAALGALTKRATVDPATLKRKIVHTHQLVKASLTAVHRFARDLRPAVLDDFGLIPALEIYVKEVAARETFQIRLKAPDELAALGNNQQTVLFRVAQEALTNVGRHARATRVELRVTAIPGAVRMEVQDNGKSFRVQPTLAATKHRRLGLLGMRERVEMVGGTLVIESSRRRGTLVRADIPLRPEETSAA